MQSCSLTSQLCIQCNMVLFCTDALAPYPGSHILTLTLPDILVLEHNVHVWSFIYTCILLSGANVFCLQHLHLLSHIEIKVQIMVTFLWINGISWCCKLSDGCINVQLIITTNILWLMDSISIGLVVVTVVSPKMWHCITVVMTAGVRIMWVFVLQFQL